MYHVIHTYFYIYIILFMNMWLVVDSSEGEWCEYIPWALYLYISSNVFPYWILFSFWINFNPPLPLFNNIWIRHPTSITSSLSYMHRSCCLVLQPQPSTINRQIHEFAFQGLYVDKTMYRSNICSRPTCKYVRSFVSFTIIAEFQCFRQFGPVGRDHALIAYLICLHFYS